jgi:hypothetical protein
VSGHDVLYRYLMSGWLRVMMVDSWGTEIEIPNCSHLVVSASFALSFSRNIKNKDII